MLASSTTSGEAKVTFQVTQELWQLVCGHAGCRRLTGGREHRLKTTGAPVETTGRAEKVWLTPLAMDYLKAVSQKVRRTNVVEGQEQEVSTGRDSFAPPDSQNRERNRLGGIADFEGDALVRAKGTFPMLGGAASCGITSLVLSQL